MTTTIRSDAAGYGALQVGGSDVLRFGSDNSGQLAGFRNRIINGNFGINQRGVSGTVTLAAGAYGHDRWKAGSSGCTYTFAKTNNVTTLTITAGTLVQVIEGLNLQSGTHILSWQGTAQGRIDSGAYGASGITGTAVGGTNQSIEFSTGTIGKVQYEEGSIATPFEHRQIGLEEMLCRRYFTKFNGALGVYGIAVPGQSIAYQYHISFSTIMRVAPTLSTTTWVDVGNMTSPSITDIRNNGFTLRATTYSGVAAISQAAGYHVDGVYASAEL